MLAKCALTVLELHWNKRFSGKNTKLNICDHLLTSSTQLQNRSFNTVERTRTSAKCQKMKNVRRVGRCYVQGVQDYCFSLSNMQMSVDESQISPLLFSSSIPYTVALFLHPLLPRCSVFQLQGCWLWTCDKLVPQQAKDASSPEPEDSIQMARENKWDRDFYLVYFCLKWY